jgi:ribosomal-protein-serine acetyltransferase
MAVPAVSPLPVDLGDGVVLRRYELGDFDQLWEAVEEERDRIGRWMPWVEGATEDVERAWLAGVVADEQGLGGGALWSGDGFLGGTGLVPDQFGVTGEIGYWIRSSHEGRGLVTAACRALIDIGFRELGLHRIVIRAGVENHRSRAVPERLGFTFEGVAREEGRGTDGFYDLAVYGLIDREWKP